MAFAEKRRTDISRLREMSLVATDLKTIAVGILGYINIIRPTGSASVVLCLGRPRIRFLPQLQSFQTSKEEHRFCDDFTCGFIQTSSHTQTSSEQKLCIMSHVLIAATKVTAAGIQAVVWQSTGRTLSHCKPTCRHCPNTFPAFISPPSCAGVWGPTQRLSQYVRVPLA